MREIMVSVRPERPWGDVDDDQTAWPLTDSWGTEPIARRYGEVSRDRCDARGEVERSPTAA